MAEKKGNIFNSNRFHYLTDGIDSDQHGYFHWVAGQEDDREVIMCHIKRKIEKLKFYFE
jgi:hypothetical protein